ncbi:ATP-binding protein [Natrialbaceae archaeon A-arb3/5]
MSLIRILVVGADNHPKFPKGFRHQFNTHLAPTADAGLAHLEDEGSTIDCIVSRFDRLETDGLDFLESVRETYPTLPFVVQIERGHESTAQAAIERGATEYHLRTEADGFPALLANRIQSAVERHQPRDDLEQQNVRLQTLIDNLPGIVYRCRNEPEWPMEYIEGECEAITGYPAAAFERGSVTMGDDLVHPDDQERIWGVAQDALNARESYEVTFRITTATGATKWIWERGRGIYDGDELESLEGFMTDVTDRKEAVRDRRRNQRRFEAVFEDPEMLVGLLDLDGTLLHVNETAMEHADAEYEEVVGARFWDSPWWADETKATVREWVETAASDEYVDYETDINSESDELNRVSGTLRPVTNDTGEPTSLIASARNITEQRDRNRQLEATRDKLAVLNQVVRHDLRNHMQVVRGRGRLLTDHVEEEGEYHLEEVIDSAEEAIDLTETARDLTETMFGDESERRRISVDRTITSAVETARSRFDHVAITVYGLGTGTTIWADEMFESVIHNLIQNAVIHNDVDLPDVTVSIEREGDTVRVSVADNGPGISDRRKETVFGRGEKGLESPGTGIGLYLVQTLVEQYGGTVWIDDNEPTGAIVRVRLPVVDASPDDPSGSASG